MNKRLNDEAIAQNLTDAGCDPEMIDEILAELQTGGHAGNGALAAFRSSLLEKLHRDQTQIDRLDYLVWMLKQQGQI